MYLNDSQRTESRLYEANHILANQAWNISAKVICEVHV